MIIVFGSINSDMVMKVPHLPQAGETIISPEYRISSGGKGANQAVAAARMGAKVAMIGCVGDDGPAVRLLGKMRRDGVMTTGVSESIDKLTGTAVVITDEYGENQIVVASGANQDVVESQIPDEILKPGNIVLMQMEVKPEENEKLIARASAAGAKTIMNLAPAIKISDKALKSLDYLIVNALEAGQIAKQLGIDTNKDSAKLAQALAKYGNLTCVVTMGEKGSVAMTPRGDEFRVPALALENMVDHTGAGDAYCGTLAAGLHNGFGLLKSMQYASVAGSLACRGHGAQSSYPYVSDIEAHLGQLENQD